MAFPFFFEGDTMPSSIILPTTELDAVNTMLGAIGETPISTLDEQPTADVMTSLNILREVSREVQTEGWSWNTEDDYPLMPDSDGHIILPQGTVRVNVPSHSCLNVIMRGTRLYNRIEHTYKFGSTLRLTITFLLPFEELPEAARRYITMKAARVFQERTVGSGTLHDFNIQDEARARALMLAEERKLDRPNILAGSSGYTGMSSVVDVLRR